LAVGPLDQEPFFLEQSLVIGDELRQSLERRRGLQDELFHGIAPGLGCSSAPVGGACSSRVVEYDCAAASTTSKENSPAPSNLPCHAWQLWLRPRAQPLNLQLRQERDEGMRAHFHDRGEVELDQRLALVGGKLELIREGRCVGHVLRA